MVYCLKGIWLYPYTVTRAKLAPDLVCQGHLRSENDIITSQLRLIPTPDLFTHPYSTYIKCFKHWYVVSRAYSFTLLLLHGPSSPQIWYVRVT